MEELENMGDEELEDLGMVLFVKSLAMILKDDEGIIIHHEGKGYAVFRNSIQNTISVMEDDEYLDLDEGMMIWMQYEGSSAPAPEFDEMIIGADETRH